MTIEFVRSVERAVCGGVEYRAYFDGVDSESPADVRVSGCGRLRIEPVYFWFTFSGVRYRAFSHLRMLAAPPQAPSGRMTKTDDEDLAR